MMFFIKKVAILTKIKIQCSFDQNSYLNKLYFQTFFRSFVQISR